MSKVVTGLAVLLAMVAVACGGSAGDPATEPSAAAPSPVTSESAATTEASQPSESASPSEPSESPSEPSEAPSEPAPTETEEQALSGGGALRPADPKSLAEVVPVRFLPKGFVIPAGGKLAKGFGRPKAGNGTFYQQLDAKPPAVAKFLRMAYRQDWDKVSDDSFTDDGVKGLSLLYQREFQETIGFTIVEEGGGSVLQVTYSNPPR